MEEKKTITKQYWNIHVLEEEKECSVSLFFFFNFINTLVRRAYVAYVCIWWPCTFCILWYETQRLLSLRYQFLLDYFSIYWGFFFVVVVVCCCCLRSLDNDRRWVKNYYKSVAVVLLVQQNSLASRIEHKCKLNQNPISNMKVGIIL